MIYLKLSTIVTFLSVAITFVLWNWNFQGLKETEMLQKDYELATKSIKFFNSTEVDETISLEQISYHSWTKSFALNE